jgi:polysaccharide export outer membrane protein
MQISCLWRNHLANSIVVLAVLCFFCSSCGNTRRLIYMQGKFDTAALSKVPIKEPVFQKGDIISIVVYSDNPEATRIFNQSLISASSAGIMASESGGTTTSATSSAVGGVNPTSGGYLVDENGNIQFQGLGLLHLQGMTRSALKDTLDARLKNLLIHPYYSIRFLNYRFTMLGEIMRPGIFSIPGERVSLLEALGMAGDMTFYGRRDNILVMRETNGKREWARLDITKPEIIGSPFFYLQSNDVVIVEPDRKKAVASDQVTIRNVTIGTAIVSTLAIIYSIFKNN